jgi:hypothetical protein
VAGQQASRFGKRTQESTALTPAGITPEACGAAAAPLLLLAHHPMVAHSQRGARAMWRHALAATGASAESLMVPSAAAAVATAALAVLPMTRSAALASFCFESRDIVIQTLQLGFGRA